MNLPVKILPGTRENIKVTSPADLEIVKTLMERSQDDYRS
jgi:2-C-methyl-D-erythritol 4-phosphate cytidylyltransferase